MSCRVVVGGYTQIGESVYIALASVLKDRIQIGNDTIIGVGSMVVKDLPPEVIAVGYPARPIKRNDKKKVFE